MSAGRVQRKAPPAVPERPVERGGDPAEVPQQLRGHRGARREGQKGIFFKIYYIFFFLVCGDFQYDFFFACLGCVSVYMCRSPTELVRTKDDKEMAK